MAETTSPPVALSATWHSWWVTPCTLSSTLGDKTSLRLLPQPATPSGHQATSGRPHLHNPLLQIGVRQETSRENSGFAGSRCSQGVIVQGFSFGPGRPLPGGLVGLRRAGGKGRAGWQAWGFLRDFSGFSKFRRAPTTRCGAGAQGQNRFQTLGNACTVRKNILRGSLDAGPAFFPLCLLVLSSGVRDNKADTQLSTQRT